VQVKGTIVPDGAFRVAVVDAFHGRGQYPGWGEQQPGADERLGKSCGCVGQLDQIGCGVTEIGHCLGRVDSPCRTWSSGSRFSRSMAVRLACKVVVAVTYSWLGLAASFGAGVAVEVALTRPEQVASLLLSVPGGSLIAEVTPDLGAFIDAERSALARGDLDGAVEANLTWWVDVPGRDAGDVDPAVRDLVRQMQRRAFEVTADWDDIQESELDPPALERLADIRVPTLVLLGVLDLDAIHDAARRVAAGIPDVRRVDWPDTAHLPSMERPDDFLALLRDWLIPSQPTSHH
jgi:pimeloyl-ACP methyl ester carboxylesterase